MLMHLGIFEHEFKPTWDDFYSILASVNARNHQLTRVQSPVDLNSMANWDVPGTNSRSGSASGKRKSDKDKSAKDKSEKSRASRSKYADWGAKSPEGQPPLEDPPQRTPAGPKPGAFTNAQPPTGGQSGPPQDPPAGSTDPVPPLPTDPPAPHGFVHPYRFSFITDYIWT